MPARAGRGAAGGARERGLRRLSRDHLLGSTFALTRVTPATLTTCRTPTAADRGGKQMVDTIGGARWKRPRWQSAW